MRVHQMTNYVVYNCYLNNYFIFLNSDWIVLQLCIVNLHIFWNRYCYSPILRNLMSGYNCSSLKEYIVCCKKYVQDKCSSCNTVIPLRRLQLTKYWARLLWWSGCWTLETYRNWRFKFVAVLWVLTVCKWCFIAIVLALLLQLEHMVNLYHEYCNLLDSL